MKKKLENVLAEVFGVDPKTIRDTSSPESIPTWDSFNGLKLVEALEKTFGLKAKIEELAKIKNVGDIRKLLKKYGVY